MDFKNIVILGGGFAGVVTCLNLEKSLPKGHKLYLIDEQPYQSFHTVLYEIASAYLAKEARIDFSKLSGTANLAHLQIFKGKRVNIIHKEVRNIDLENNQIEFFDDIKLSYNFLVFALGSQTEYYKIPGAEANSYPFKTTEDALNVRNLLLELFFNKGPNQNIRIAIAGGGSTGCELAAELVGFVKKLSKKGNFKYDDIKITIVEASDSLLGPASLWLKGRAEKRIERLGIEIICSCAVVKVESKRVITKNGSKIDFDILIWTAGVRGPQLLSSVSNLPLDEKGRIKVKNDLVIEGFDDVFAIGDNSYCFESVSDHAGVGYPQTAQVAVAQAKAVAKNIVAKTEDRPLLNFEKLSHPFIVPLGGKYALADFGMIKLTGIFGWLVKKIVEFKYLILILPFSQAFKIWLRGVIIYGYND